MIARTEIRCGIDTEGCGKVRGARIVRRRGSWPGQRRGSGRKGVSGVGFLGAVADGLLPAVPPESMSPARAAELLVLLPAVAGILLQGC
jgi:hypothetical protein